jgi:hypothetical protein
MGKKIVLGILALGILCVATGFAVGAIQTSLGVSREATSHVALTGDDGGSGKPFSCKPLGDEGGPGKPFCNCTI